MTVLYYGIIFAYIFLLIFGIGTLVQKLADTEISRKVIHIMLFAVWVMIDAFFRNTIHQIIIPVAFIVLNLLSYRFHIYKSVERETGNHLGTVYFAVAVTFVMAVSYFVPELFLCGGVAIFCLTFGDGFAALIGHIAHSPKLFEEKSTAGFAACAAASMAAVGVFSAVYGVGFSAPEVISLGLVTAVFELTGFGLDNYTIVLSTFALSGLYLYGDAGRALPAVFVALAVFAVVFLAKSITYYGALLSLIIVFAFYYCGGGFGIGYLLATYFTIFTVSFCKRKFFHVPKREKPRNLTQIAINGGFGTLFVIIYGMTGKLCFLEMCVAAIGGCFVDSVSSDVGVLSHRKPYDLLKRRTVEIGMSGGMSILGTGSALLAAALIGMASYFCLNHSISRSAVLFALIFGQTLLDTACGSLLQVKYCCAVCGAATEKKQHCGEPAAYSSGISWMDNNMVNLLTSAVISAFAAFALYAG